MAVTREGVVFNERITLPHEPFIGTLGVSPEIEAISSLTPDYYGGNRISRTWARAIYFPVQHEGAFLYVGDCHGTQGDASSAASRSRSVHDDAHVDLIGLADPLAEARERAVHHVDRCRPMEDAARIAHRDLVRWLVADYGFEESEAYFL